jgi:hypothetical protein
MLAKLGKPATAQNLNFCKPPSAEGTFQKLKGTQE